jgi:GTP-binding protein Era
MTLSHDIKRSGFVAIVGRPNVGKSSLLNALIGQKVAITSFHPQTTRHKIQGIKTTDTTQIVYVDTPGMHLGQKRALNHLMNKAAHSALQDVDVVVWVIESGRFTDEDALALEAVRELPCPVVLAINKVDKIKDKTALLPFIADLSQKMTFHDIVPISVKTGAQLDVLENILMSLMKEDVFYFGPDTISNRSQFFQLSELMREATINELAEELPHAVTVEIEGFSKEGKQYQIAAVLWVERESQKPILIGEKGERLKTISTNARLEMEHYLQAPVFLQVWVKVKEHWRENVTTLRQMGYDPDHDSF